MRPGIFSCGPSIAEVTAGHDRSMHSIVSCPIAATLTKCDLLHTWKPFPRIQFGPDIQFKPSGRVPGYQGKSRGWVNAPRREVYSRPGWVAIRDGVWSILHYGSALMRLTVAAMLTTTTAAMSQELIDGRSTTSLGPPRRRLMYPFPMVASALEFCPERQPRILFVGVAPTSKQTGVAFGCCSVTGVTTIGDTTTGSDVRRNRGKARQWNSAFPPLQHLACTRESGKARYRRE